VWSFLRKIFRKEQQQPTDRKYALEELYVRMGGFYPSGKEDNFRLALTHASHSSHTGSNFEQLEFLGDAMLNAIVAEQLLQLFPKKREGELSKMRSWLVSRRQLNAVANEIGIEALIVHNITQKRMSEVRNIGGNVFEALIGAYYLDGGLDVVRAIATQSLLTPALIQEAQQGIIDPISILYEWSQKKRVPIRWSHQAIMKENADYFKVELYVNHQLRATGEGRSKKDAERMAASQAVQAMGI
jgi:ribonuclease III